ncbi:MAG: UbiX family flavin prenyltransferase, partial [Burkholderiaceae bacterium]|nr:UbiX family flavin prenyltransferase [Burkholderiaceae bacterium]
SFPTRGMLIAPCSIKTLSAVANSYAATLTARAADVCLKERRRLVLLPREAPLNLAHIRNMEAVTLMGGVIFPPVPAFYARPRTLEEMVDQTLARVLDLFGISHALATRWTGLGHEV